MRFSLKTLTAAALAFGGVVAFQPEPASAQPANSPYWYGGYAGSFGYRPAVGGGYYGNRYGAYGGYGGGYGYRRAYYGGGYRPYYGGYRPYYGYRGAYYGGGYPYYRRGWDGGGAVAAGLIGGLALGTVAAAATNPYYYGTGYHRPAYYAPASSCVTERRRIVNRYGRVVVRRVQTCY